MMLEELLANTEAVGGFTAEWDRAFQQNTGTGAGTGAGGPTNTNNGTTPHSRDQLFDLINTSSPSSEPAAAQGKQNISNQSFLPSQLFELSASGGGLTASQSLIPPPSSSFSAKQTTGINHLLTIVFTIFLYRKQAATEGHERVVQFVCRPRPPGQP